MFRPSRPIRTERLVLRRFRMDDLDALHDIERRPEVARYEYWEPRTREETAESLEKKANSADPMAEGDWLGLVITRQDSEEVIGDVALQWASEQWQQGELGYMLHPDHQGHGYATEASTALLRLGFEEFKLHRIIARADARNTASVGVMRRLGMRQEGLFRESEFVKNEWCDEVVFAMLDEEFAAR
jgi:RimJ/RimL family protein N-acetyltransferase